MKVIAKVGIVLAVVFSIIGCQKEEVAPVVEETTETPRLIEQGGNLATLNGGPNATTGGEYQSPVEPHSNNTQYPAPDVVDNLKSVRVGQNVVLINEKNQASVSIIWSEQAPTGDHWLFVEAELDGKDNQAKAAIPGPIIGVPPCPYEDCSTAIPGAVAYYQQIANEMCQDIYVCIACCSGGGILYAMLYIQHDCGIVAEPAPDPAY